jgi:hypothetical protein
MEPGPSESSDPKVALAATDRPLPLRLATIDDERAPDGMACIGSFLGPKLVARCVVPPDAAAFLLERGLFAEPVRLALAAREEPPGLQCQLFALVDLPGDFFDAPEGEEEEEEGAAPWADSLPGAAYDRAIQEETGAPPAPGPEEEALAGPDDEGDEGDEGDEEDEEELEDEDDDDALENDADDAADGPEEDVREDRQAAVFLGQIVRFEHDRKHPGDLALETMDVLRTIVQGDVSEVVDKVLEDLLGEAGPP